MSEPVEEQPRTGDGKAASVSSSATTVSAGSASTGSASTGSASTGPTSAGSTSAGSTTSDTAAGAPPAGSEVGPSHALLGPFTLREVVFGAGVLVVFIGTLLPFIGGRVLYTTFWSSTSLFFIGIGILLPVIALALLAGRRLGSSGLRVGSLSVDQFASVTAVLAATFFFLQTVTAFHFGAFLGLIGSLGLLAATVLGAFLPVIRNDFADRPEVAAHPLARPITVAVPRPPKAAEPAVEGTTRSGSDLDAAPAPDGASISGPSPAGSGRADGTGSGIEAPNARGARGVGVAGGSGVGLDSAVAAGPAAATRSPITSGGSRPSGSASSASSAEAAAQNGSSSSGPVPEDATNSDSGHTGARAVGTSSDERDAAREATSTFGSGRTPDVHAAVDTTEASTGTAVDETRVHEAVRDDAEATGAAATTANTSSAGGERSRQEPITATRSADEEQVVEAFWFAVGSPRPVFDEQSGKEIFVLQPGDWEVGIEDRGRDFLVQDKRSGAVGILRDLRNIERAPRD